jgi:uncharacterized membrane protein YidH (DUF202 family)
LDNDAGEEPSGIDSGLAAERTLLAWNRSGLAVAVTVVIVLRRLWPLHGDREVVALGLIAVGAATWAAGMRIAHRRGMSAGSQPALSRPAGRMLTIGTLALALAAFVAGWL